MSNSISLEKQKTVNWHQKHSSLQTILLAIDLNYNKHTDIVQWALNNIINPEKHKLYLFTTITECLQYCYSSTTLIYNTDDLVELHKANIEKATAELLKLRHLIHKEIPEIPVELVITTGEAADEICDFVNIKENGVDLVIVGTKGFKRFKRAFLGSVSDYCVHHCDCSVMVCKDS